MREYFEGHQESDGGEPPGLDGAQFDDVQFDGVQRVNLEHLEEVGDLHFHASGFSSALDYYLQVIGKTAFASESVSTRLRVLRKCVDCLLKTGQFTMAERYLDKAEMILSHDISDDDHHEVQEAVERALFQVRRAVYFMGISQHHDALRLAKRAFAVLALTDEHKEVARLQAAMGIVHHRLGRMEKAEEFYYDSLATYRRIGFENGVANLMNNLALIKKNACRWNEALGLLEKAIALANRIGASHLLPGLYLNQGITLTKSNRHGEARSYLEKGLSHARSLGDRLHLCRLKLALGRLESQEGRQARAEEWLLDGKIMAEENSYRREAVIADEYLGDVLLNRGQPDKALFNYELGLEKSRSIASGNDLEGELLRRVGEAHLNNGDFQEAVAVSQAAIAVCEQCGEIYELGFCHLVMARSYVGLNDTQQLVYHFQEAISIFKDQGLVRQWCEAILAFAELRLNSGREEELLKIRRFLMNAQEKGASSVSDEILCRVLEALSRIQIQLSQFDDALLSVFELERHAVGLEDSAWGHKVTELRRCIEVGLVGGADDTDRQEEAISSVPSLFSSTEGSIPRNLKAVLDAGMDRVRADSGFIAMLDDNAISEQAGAADGAGAFGTAGVGGCAGLEIISHKGLTENLAEQLCRWIGRQDNGLATVRYYSRLGPQDAIVADVPALAKHAACCVFVPLSRGDRQFGFVFLSQKASAVQNQGFGRNSLDFLTTTMGFLALFLAEKDQKGEIPDSIPVQRVKSFESIITQSDRMLEVLELARKVAPSDLTVLLNGETGTGKGLLANSIHALSHRSDKKIVQINCAAIPESLLESELFGHVKGAFTGADSDKAGLLTSAEGGTVFLDEIGKMPLSMQGKLLQFLDTKSVRPVGGNRERIVDVRLVVASKGDLHAAVLQGAFLEDLYYRLVEFPLTIPPLRERAGDVQVLTRHFVQRFSREISGKLLAIDQGFMDALGKFHWPGNVRELEKVMKRAIVLGQFDGVLRKEHLPAHIATPENGAFELPKQDVIPLKETLAGIELREITKALGISAGNKSAAARLLKVSYPTLLNKIRHYGIAQEN